MRKKSLLAWIAVLLMSALALSVCFPMAVSAEEKSTVGLAFAEKYYRSAWVGSEVRKASYANWIRGDGEYNGAWQWGNEYNKVNYDSERGVITFRETNGLSLKFYPGQISVNPLEEGASYTSVDIYYESGTYTKDGVQVPNFPGLSYDLHNLYTIYSVDSTGKFYIGNKPGKSDAVKVGQMTEGWNTVEIIYLPLDADGKIVESAGEIPYMDPNAPWQINPAWPIKKVEVYVRLGNSESPVSETRAFTAEDLARDWHKVSNIKSDRKFFSDAGGNTYLKTLTNGCGQFSIANAVAANLIPNQSVYQHTYTDGQGRIITQAVSATAANREVTVPTGTKADGTPVISWYDGGEKYLKPGDKTVITSSTAFTAATGEAEKIGMLGAAIERVNSDLTVYTYAQLQAEIDNIKEAAKAAGLDTSHKFMQRGDAKIEELRTRMDAVKAACTDVITRAEIIENENLPFSERVAAFEVYRGYESELDATYSAETAAAMDKVTKFRSGWENVEIYYKAYVGLIAQVDKVPAGGDKNLLYMTIMQSFLKIAEYFPTVTLEEGVGDGFEANIAASRAEFGELTDIGEMYAFLFTWVKAWNAYCEAEFFGQTVSAPTEMIEAVRLYNDAVVAVNREIVESVTVCVTVQNGHIGAPTAAVMLADIKSKVQYLFDAVQNPDD